MREFIDPIDIEFHKQNSIYDITTDLRKEFIILELDKTMVKNGRYYKSFIDSNSPIFGMQYGIIKQYDPSNYHPSTGYVPKVVDFIGITASIRIGDVNGVDCLLISLSDESIVNINHLVKDDEEYDFSILGVGGIIKGDVLTCGIDTNMIRAIEYIVFNKRKKNEETGI